MDLDAWGWIWTPGESILTNFGPNQRAVPKQPASPQPVERMLERILERILYDIGEDVGEDSGNEQPQPAPSGQVTPAKQPQKT